GPVALIAARVARDLGLLLPISVALLGLWLIGLGWMTVRLPAPLPRRAVVGGIGYLLVAAWFVLAATPLGWPLLVVGGLCCVSVLGLIFGLIDLDRLLPPASASAVAFL